MSSVSEERVQDITFGEAECERCREDFPALQRSENGQPLVYLDGPAGTQVPQVVIDAVSEIYANYNVNTHGQFATSREVDYCIMRARQAMAHFLGADDARQISFGPSMTTLTILLSHAFGRAMQRGDEVLVTQLDHEANRGPWLKLAERGVSVHEVAMTPDGQLDYEDFEKRISEKTKLIAVGLAANALGTVNDITRIQNLARGAGAMLIVDAVHFTPHFVTDVAALDPDVLICSAYKFYGPHVGIMYSRPGLLEKLDTDALRCQSQGAPSALETGTLNHAALAGVTAAVGYISSWGVGDTPRQRISSAMEAIGAYEHQVANYYYDQVSKIPDVKVWGPDFSSRLRAPTVSITIGGTDPADIVRRLGDKGIQVWGGHFYAIRPVEVLGLADKGGLLRVGISMYNTRDEIDRFLTALADL